VDEVDRVVDERLEPGHHRQVVGRDLVGVEAGAVVALGQHEVLVADGQVELLTEDLRVEQVLDPDAHPHGLVGVRGPMPRLVVPSLFFPR